MRISCQSISKYQQFLKWLLVNPKQKCTVNWRSRFPTSSIDIMLEKNIDYA